MLILATLNRLWPYSVLWGETDTDFLTTRCRAWTTSNFIFCLVLYFLPAVDSELFSLPDCSTTDTDTREQIISLGVLQLILSSSIEGCFRESCPSWHKNTSPEIIDTEHDQLSHFLRHAASVAITTITRHVAETWPCHLTFHCACIKQLTWFALCGIQTWLHI